jgi:hypothetical protein
VVAAWRYLWRLLGLRGATSTFVAVTSDGVRLVEDDAFVLIPWRAIRPATVHRHGRRSRLLLAVDPSGTAAAGQTVLRLPLRAGSTDSRKIGQALRAAGRIRFDPQAWPDREDA